MRIAVVGGGLVGRRVTEQLVDSGHEVTLVGLTHAPEPCAGATIRAGWASSASSVVQSVELAVLATGSARQLEIASECLTGGVHVVSTADDPVDLNRLWQLDELARSHHRSLVVGAAYSPGVSSLLAAWLAQPFDTIAEISTARFGTGGPTCARQHHASMTAPAFEVRSGNLGTARSGSGRVLVWFPEPVGSADCYRAGLGDPVVLHHGFPDVPRVQSRQAATRRDRLTAHLPMLRSPHAEGLLGAVWAEVRGVINGRVEHRVMAATAPQATGAAVMAAVMAERVAQSVATGNKPMLGAQSTASAQNPGDLLRAVSREVRLWTYDGSQQSPVLGAQPELQAARKWQFPRSIATIQQLR